MKQNKAQSSKNRDGYGERRAKMTVFHGGSSPLNMTRDTKICCFSLCHAWTLTSFTWSILPNASPRTPRQAWHASRVLFRTANFWSNSSRACSVSWRGASGVVVKSLCPRARSWCGTWCTTALESSKRKENSKSGCEEQQMMLAGG